MEEIGIDMSRQPASIGRSARHSFDLIVTLSPEAHHQALDLAHGSPSRWNIGRRRIQRWPPAAASRSSTPTAPCATACSARSRRNLAPLGAGRRSEALSGSRNSFACCGGTSPGAAEPFCLVPRSDGWICKRLSARLHRANGGIACTGRSTTTPVRGCFRPIERSRRRD